MKSSKVIPGKVLSTLMLILTSFSCRSSPTGPHITQNVQLSADYVACTEVWLKISFGDTLGGSFAINRDGNTVLSGHFSGADTTVIDTTALPERTYNYVCWSMVNGLPKDSSSNLQVQTMDTTSNNFTWRAYTFGGNAGSCILKDVAIINDTDIWAVGAIPLKDSSENGYTVYNLVGWSGREWQPQRVYSYTFCGQADMGSYSSWAIAPWTATDLWVATNSEVVRWDGHMQSDPLCVEAPTGFDIFRLWGADSSYVYAVGRAGGLAAYNHGWQILSSGTNLDIHDIWGITDSTTRQQQVLAVASDQFTNNGVAVLQLSGTQATMLQTSGLPTTSIVGVWSGNGKEWYVCGDGLYVTRNLNQPWQQIKDIPSIYTEAIRGNAPNDIFVVGDFGLVLHFNGSNWTNLSQQANIPNSVLYAICVKGNTAVAVGQTVSGLVGGAALVLVGIRN